VKVIDPSLIGPLSALSLTILSVTVRILAELSLLEVGSDLSLSSVALHFEYLLELLVNPSGSSENGNNYVWDGFLLVGLLIGWFISLILIKRQIKTDYKPFFNTPLYAVGASIVGVVLIIIEMMWRLGVWK